MTQSDRIGHGVQLQRSSDGTANGTFTSVGTVRDSTPPGVSRETEDVTHMQSLERWMEFIGALKDPGEMEFQITFDPGSPEHLAFHSDINTDDAGYYKLIFPDTTEWGFAGLVTSIDPEAPVANKMEASITIKLTGKPGFIA